MRSLYFFLIGHPVILTVCAAGALVLGSSLFGLRREERCAAVFPKLHVFSLWVATAVLLTFAASYYTSSTLLDHVEAQVAATGALVHRGGAPYHLMDGSAAYALGYGPFLYHSVAAAYALFGNSITAAKLATLCANATSLLAMVWLLRRNTPDRPLRRFLPLYFTLLAVPFAAGVWLRADPFLVACAALGWVSLELRPSWLGGMLLGGLAAVAISLKIHGAVYLLPQTVVFIKRCGVRPLAPGIVTGIVGVLTPLIPWDSAGRAYLSSIAVNAHHGFVFSQWVQNMEFSAFLMLPLLLVLPCRATPSAATRSHSRVEGAALVVSALLVSAIAAKPGAGPWHLLPLVPSIVVITALYRQAPGHSPAWRPVALAAFGITAAFLGWTRHDDWIIRLFRDPAAADIREITDYMASHPEERIVMGIGDSNLPGNYDLTFTRPVLVLAGQPYTFDPACIMDLRKGGFSDAIACPFTLLADSHPTIVLVPKGERPFEARSFYHGFTFSDSFRAEFHKQYVPAGGLTHFDIWRPKSPPN